MSNLNPSSEHLILSDFATPTRTSSASRTKSSESTATYASKSPLHSNAATPGILPTSTMDIQTSTPRFASHVDEKKGRHESIMIEKGWRIDDVAPKPDRRHVSIPSLGGELPFATPAPQLEFADGDYLPNNKFSKRWLALLNSSMLIRWTIYIVPVTGLIWIPGILQLTDVAPNAKLFSVPLLYVSIWFSVIWVGWFITLLIGLSIPWFLRSTIGTIAPESKHYIDYLNALPRYIAFVFWSLTNWVVFIAVIRKHGERDNTQRNGTVLRQVQQFVFAIFLDAILLFGIKLIVQMIAYNFHRKSYEDRIAQSKAQIRTLIRLYIRSKDVHIPEDSSRGFKSTQLDPSKALKKALKEVRKVATTTTTMLGTVASELAGERILQPNSPGSIVTTALNSANKTRALAKRIFYSFVSPHRDSLVLEDIEPLFDTPEQAEFAFAQFDRDENGDASLEEVEMACLDIHRERLALASSMRDLDSAVARLNSILVSVYSVVAILIILGLMDIGFNNLLLSAGTLILGLSWLIGATAQEILSSIIFLFIKHPYDVSDRVDIDGQAYVVKEMALLSTVFRQTDGKLVQLPHSVLNSKAVSNIRRSGPISEKFEWNVDFSTSFAQIEKLREKMLDFLVAEKRDFLPVMDISITNFEDQTKMTLTSDIKYKSNWQNGALKSQRRNKWICALKLSMASLRIYGPNGAGNPNPDPEMTHVHLVTQDPAITAVPAMPTPKFNPTKESSYSFFDKKDVLTDPDGDVFEDSKNGTPSFSRSGTASSAQLTQRKV